MLQREADGLRELGPTVRDGGADQLAEQGAVLVQSLQQRHRCWDKPDLRMKRHVESPTVMGRPYDLEMQEEPTGRSAAETKAPPLSTRAAVDQTSVSGCFLIISRA